MLNQERNIINTVAQRRQDDGDDIQAVIQIIAKRTILHHILQLAIRRSDTHNLVVRQPSIPAEINRPLDAAHPIYQRIAAGERRGTLEFVAQTDGVRRIHAYSVLEQYPFYVVAGLSEADIMAAWRQRSLIVGGLGLGLFWCLGIVLVWLFRAQKRELLAAEALHRHQDQLKAAQRIAQVGSWEIDLATRGVTASEELYRIFEVEPVAGGAHYDDFMARIHPDDQATVDRALNDSVQEHRPVSLKHRLLLPDGRIKYVLECCEPEYAADGTALRVIGTSQDVTSQHQMEARMQLLVSAFLYSGEAILITDADNNIITINPAFTRLTGFLPEEAGTK